MRARTALVALALLLAVAAVPAAGMAATDTTVMADQHANETDGAANATEGANASVAPGERLSGVVGVQEAELDGEVEGRAFGIRVAGAATNESRADVVAEQLSEIEQRLNETEQRKQELREARENGSISEGKYRAEMAKLAAQTETAKELTDRSENASQGLPADLLESKGINVSAIQTLKDRADQLTGPEVAEIARSIAGETAPGAGPPEDRGPGSNAPDDAGDGNGDDADADSERGASDRGSPEDRNAGDGDAEDTDDEDTATPTPDDSGAAGDGADNAGGGSGGDGGDGGSGGSY